MNIEALFEECVARGASGRFRLDYVMQYRGHRYATDGRIVVRTRHRVESIRTVDREEDMPALGALSWDGHRPEPLVLPAGHTFQCRRIQCPQCRGQGQVVCDLDHEHECPRCDGSGESEPDWLRFDFGVVCVNERYLGIVMRHGGALYPSAEAEPSGLPLYVRFDDVTDGLLMPMLSMDHVDVVKVDQ